MAELTEYEKQFLGCLYHGFDLPFGGAAGNAVLDFLQEFGLVDPQYRVTEKGVSELSKFDESFYA